MTQPKSINQQILEMARRPEGVSSKCIPGSTGEDIATRCCTFVRDGKLYRGGSGRGKVRYFADPKAAEAFSAKQRAQAMVIPAKLPSQTRANFAKDAKVVMTADTKITICPSYKPRYEAIPLPGNLSVQKGRVLADDGQPAPARASEMEAAHG